MPDVAARLASGAVWTYASYATARLLVFGGVTLLDVGAWPIVRSLAPGLLTAVAVVLVVVLVLHLTDCLPGWLSVLAAAAFGGMSWAVVIAGLRRKTVRRAGDALNVAMLMQSFHPRIGGAETNLQALIAPLREFGVEASVVTRQFTGMSLTDRVAGAPVCRLPVPGGQVQASLTFVGRALWLLMRARPIPDVLHAHELRSPTLAAVCVKLVLRRPVVAHVLRGGLLGDVAVLHAAPLGRLRMRIFTCLVDQFVAVSEESRGELLAAGVPDARITPISYGVDTARFRPADSREREYHRRLLDLHGRQVVLALARLVPEKGFTYLLAAWPAVKAALPEALLVIAGDGSERAALMRQAEHLSGVRFDGEQRDPLPYLQSADCFVLPSFTEGQPISLLEALATGLPCVATDIGGISEALLGGRLGTLVPPGDAVRLAEALIRVLAMDDDARAALAAAARQEIEACHTVQKNAAALRQLYDRVTRLS